MPPAIGGLANGLTVFLALLTVFMAILPIWWLWTTEAEGKVVSWLKLMIAISWFAFAFLAAPWVLVSLYLRMAFLALFTVAGLRFVRTAGRRPEASPVQAPRWFQTLLMGALLFGGLTLDLLIFGGWTYTGNAVELSFPLRNGTYAVLQGGKSPVTNFFHRSNPSQRYALDVVRVNWFGNRAKGIRPRQLDAYEIFGDAVYSPCEGSVRQARDGIADNAPGEVNQRHPAGNHILMVCAEAQVLLAHLQRGSVAVKDGDLVLRGLYVGRVGNSGNTLEPHLHVSAEVDPSLRKDPEPKPLPLTFDGRFLSMNSVVASRPLR